MKNSILKSYLKKILRSEAVISVIIVFVLALGIIGSSYALYMDVDTDTEYQLVEVGDLKISFDHADDKTSNPNHDYSKIELTNLLPMEDDYAITQSDNIFSFRIFNTGNYTVNYNIKLVTMDGNEVDSSFINFQLCKHDANNCDSIKTLSTIEDNIIYNDKISPSKDTTESSNYYFMRIWINNTYQSAVEEKVILKVIIEAQNASGYYDNPNTLAGAILNNPNIKINNDIPDFSTVEKTEKGLYTTQDDYGVSYYFRGKQSYNYVDFAGMIWRIVRINGDGSIRITLEDFSDTTLKTAYNNYHNGTNYTGLTDLGNITSYRSNKSDATLTGYMHATLNNLTTTKTADYTESFEEAIRNDVKSDVMIKLEGWYENNLLSYDKYISDNIFCGDKRVSNARNFTFQSLGPINTTNIGFGGQAVYFDAVTTNKTMTPSEAYNLVNANYQTVYSFYDRLVGATTNGVITPSLECAKGANETVNVNSRYTANTTSTNKGVLTNDLLNHPIGLLSADEMAFAGALIKNGTHVANTAYYLYSASTYWTMTPYSYIIMISAGEATPVPYIFASMNSRSLWYYNSRNSTQARPVINLNKDILIKGGDGTSANPYQIKYD